MNRIRKLASVVKEGVSNPEKIKKGLKVLKNQGPVIFKERLSNSINYEPGYGRTRKVKLKSYSGDILFSIVMPVYNVDLKWLDKAIESIEKQNYKNWEICIADDCSPNQEVREHLLSISNNKIKVKLLDKNQGISGATNEAASLASGDYILLMDNDDELAHSALHEFYQKIKKDGSEILYSDMDIIDAKGRTRDPLCKPDWSPDLFLSQMYLGHLVGFKKSLFDEVGGFRSEFNGSQDYDLLLRMTEKTDKIGHVAEILYHWRDLPSSTAANPESKPYAQIAGLNAIQEHLNRVYGSGKAIAHETDNLFVYDVRYPMEEEPMVSIIIPIKDHVELLKAAIDSIFEKTTYKHYEIIVLNNNSEKEETFAYLKELVECHENVRVEDALFEFNWSKLNNYGMQFANGDVFVCLNNDVKVIEPEWLTRLVEKAIRSDVGVVGGLLLYEDNTIQHAGVVIGMGGWADHVFKGMPPQHYGSPFISPMVTRNVSAVTGACLAVSRKTIEKIGGFNEQFIVCGSDIELALRANKHGLVNIYDPNVKLYHFESKSRDASKIPQIDFDLSDKMYKDYRKNGDPYFNRNLDYYCCQPKIRTSAVLTESDKEEKMLLRRKRETGLPQLDTNVYEITPFTFRKADYENRRINLLVPSINAEHVFGGISTALKFFDTLVNALGYDARIILTDAEPNKEAIKKYSGNYTFVKAEDDLKDKKQIVPYSNRFNRSIPVSEKDYFLFTGWWTAYCCQDAYVGFESTFGMKPNTFLYFIQDYEPGFYSWSTKYLLADSTYKNDYPTIAIFNSMLLKEYFENNHYHFAHSFAFDPVLNDGLRNALEKIPEQVRKKKQILVYGRPGTERNAFNLVVAALKKWVFMQPDIEEWEILSAGEMHRTVALGNGKELTSVGKLSIEEYANMLEESYAGISLMCSPHPSYPPLEMSVFDVKTITNTYANKDLKEFNENIISLDNISPMNIAKHLVEICKSYQTEVRHIAANPLYVKNDHVFDFVEDIKKILDEE